MEKNCDTLTITGVAPEDEGTYTCIVENNSTDKAKDVSDALKLVYCSKWLAKFTVNQIVTFSPILHLKLYPV